jgi:alpha-mannosidase
MTMTDKPIVHLICNAHLDPVWKWPWEEGAREAVSTFHTAADLLAEFPEFIFNHNESVLYEWVEEYDPPLFERIRALVQAGRWHISGGWYLQPDVKLLGGETLVRCIREGRRYFDEKFGVRPTVAYNFDSFGHAAGLPQVLVQSGFSLYIHCRPTAKEFELPAPLYRWRGVDGTEVLGVRPEGVFYCTPNREYTIERQDAVTQARTGIALARTSGQDVLVPWGLGDHGGGATRGDLEKFRVLFEEMVDADVIVQHSTPEAFLVRVQPDTDRYPIHQGELEQNASGCYTSIAPVKRRTRQVDALLTAAERWAAVAWWRYGTPYPAETLREAWKRQSFNTFHDILPGSCIEHALPGVHDMFGAAADAARRILVGSQQVILPHVDPTPATVPLYVLNPHGTPLRGFIGSNFLRTYTLADNKGPYALYDDQGQRVLHQERGGPFILEDSTIHPFIGFVAEVPPMSARRYEIRFEDTPVSSRDELAVTQDESGIAVQNAWWHARFDRVAGCLNRLVERKTGRDLLQTAVRLIAGHDTANAWVGHRNAIYTDPAGSFEPLNAAEIGAFVGQEDDQRGQALRVLHEGPVAVTIECLVGWQYTRASLQFTLYATLPYIDVDVRLYMQARQKMIKLVLPFDLPDVAAWSEIPFGAAQRSTDETEHHYLRWVRLETSSLTVGVANNGQSGFSVSPTGVLGLSLSRGAAHALGGEHLPLDPNRSYTFMDQEQIDTRFRIIAGPHSPATQKQLILAAAELNQPLEHFFMYHTPTLPDSAAANPAPFLTVEPGTVLVSAVKKADLQDALVIRLHETAGVPTEATVHLDGTEPLAVSFAPYEIKTLLAVRRQENVNWRESNLLEE